MFSDRKKDALAAEHVLGYTAEAKPVTMPSAPPVSNGVMFDVMLWTTEYTYPNGIPLPHFGTDANAAHQLFVAIQSKGLRYTFLNHLAMLVAYGCLNLDDVTGREYDDPEASGNPPPLDGDDLWLLVCAPPDKIRDAALRAVGVEV